MGGRSHGFGEMPYADVMAAVPVRWPLGAAGSWRPTLTKPPSNQNDHSGPAPAGASLSANPRRSAALAQAACVARSRCVSGRRWSRRRRYSRWSGGQPRFQPMRRRSQPVISRSSSARSAAAGCWRTQCRTTRPARSCSAMRTLTRWRVTSLSPPTWLPWPSPSPSFATPSSTLRRRLQPALRLHSCILLGLRSGSRGRISTKPTIARAARR
jgi:hypothetical protein